MPLKPTNSPEQEHVQEHISKAQQKAENTFNKINKFSNLSSTTEILSIRVPKGQKETLRLAFARRGETLAQGIKKVIYDYLNSMEKN